MLTEKEVIGPGTVWYNDLKTGDPRKVVVTAEHIQHWCEQGNKMLSLGLTVPVPCEHDFQAHPMTPAEKLANNAGWVKQYKIKGDKLFSILDIQDEELAKKLPKTVRWTSPWFSSFTDGNGNKWDNVIAHLALTTRPRVTQQKPFPSLAAAIATAVDGTFDPEGLTLSRAGMLKSVGEKLVAECPIAFSLYSGIALSEEDIEDEVEVEEEEEEEDLDEGDYKKLLHDLLRKLGVPLPEIVTEGEFKDVLKKAAALKLTELTTAARIRKPQNNPIVQEQQPMYMNLEEIAKIPDETMRNIALSMYNENVKLRSELEKNAQATVSLRDMKLAEEAAKRKMRVDRLGRISPKVKADLDAMSAMPAMALSLGDNGVVTDPMGQTLSVLEKGLSDLPAMLQTSQTALTVQPHPTDGEMSEEAINTVADSYSRMMGCPPEKKS